MSILCTPRVVSFRVQTSARSPEVLPTYGLSSNPLRSSGLRQIPVFRSARSRLDGDSRCRGLLSAPRLFFCAQCLRGGSRPLCVTFLFALPIRVWTDIFLVLAPGSRLAPRPSQVSDRSGPCPRACVSAVGTCAGCRSLCSAVSWDLHRPRFRAVALASPQPLRLGSSLRQLGRAMRCARRRFVVFLLALFIVEATTVVRCQFSLMHR